MRGKGEKSTVTLGDFNITVPTTDNTSREKSVKI